MARIIIDAGPIVALLNADDQYHAWSRDAFSRVETPLFTCDAVLSEVCFRLPRHRLASVRQMIEHGILDCSLIERIDLPAIFSMMEKYHEVPMSFADGCLVRMIERNHDSVLLTTDGDFTVYRQHRRRLIPLIAPFSS